MYQVARHPIQTAKGLANAVMHPVQTAKAIYQDVKEKAGTSQGRGELVFDIATSAISYIKIGKVAKIANAVDNVSDVASGAKTAAGAGKNVAKSADNTLDVTKIAPKVDTRPTYRTNPQHDPHSPLFNPRKTPEPSNAAEIFSKAKKDPSKQRVYYGIVDKKTVYRFSDSGDGTAHFPGMFVGNEAKNLIRKMEN